MTKKIQLDPSDYSKDRKKAEKEKIGEQKMEKTNDMLYPLK